MVTTPYSTFRRHLHCHPHCHLCCSWVVMVTTPSLPFVAISITILIAIYAAAELLCWQRHLYHSLPFLASSSLPSSAIYSAAYLLRWQRHNQHSSPFIVPPSLSSMLQLSRYGDDAISIAILIAIYAVTELLWWQRHLRPFRDFDAIFIATFYFLFSTFCRDIAIYATLW